jgi:membrane AbrB-like protein
VAVAAAGGLAAFRLKIPAGLIIGSLVGVAALQIFTGAAALPANAKLFTQIVAGLFIGKNIRRQDFAVLRPIAKYAFITVAGVIAFSLAMGFVLYLFSGYDLVTSLFCAAPGGIIDMTLAAHDLGGDAAVVSLHQLFRFIGVVALIPAILSKNAAKPQKPCCGQPQSVRLPGKEDWPADKKRRWALLTFGAATAGGLIGRLSGIPAGAIIFSLFGAAALNIGSGSAYMPIWAKRVAQLLAGALIGSGITLETLISLRSAILTTTMVLAGFLTMNLALGFLLHRISGIDLMTSFFSCCPGGLSDIVLIADDFGVDMPKLTVIQVLRCVCVLGLYPSVVYLVSLWLAA